MSMMKSIMIYKKWDIVLVPFPFTDLSITKKRPALIISPDEYNRNLDVVIVFITSQSALEYRFGDYGIQKWKDANLPKPSTLRMKFATIDKSIIIKKLGQLDNTDRDNFTKILIQFFTQ